MNDMEYKAICLQQAEIIEQMSELARKLIAELEQFRAVDAENAMLEDITAKCSP